MFKVINWCTLDMLLGAPMPGDKTLILFALNKDMPYVRTLQSSGLIKDKVDEFGITTGTYVIVPGYNEHILGQYNIERLPAMLRSSGDKSCCPVYGRGTPQAIVPYILNWFDNQNL